MAEWLSAETESMLRIGKPKQKRKGEICMLTTAETACAMCLWLMIFLIILFLAYITLSLIIYIITGKNARIYYKKWFIWFEKNMDELLEEIFIN